MESEPKMEANHVLFFFFLLFFFISTPRTGAEGRIATGGGRQHDAQLDRVHLESTLGHGHVIVDIDIVVVVVVVVVVVPAPSTAPRGFQTPRRRLSFVCLFFSFSVVWNKLKSIK